MSTLTEHTVMEEIVPAVVPDGAGRMATRTAHAVTAEVGPAVVPDGAGRVATRTEHTVTTPAARIESGEKTYSTGNTVVRALAGVDIAFDRGAFTAIMGPSGSGKSTLMHCMAGLDRLSAGRAFIGDVELGSLSERELTDLRRSRIGFVFQAYNLIPSLTAAENIRLPMSLTGRVPDQASFDHVVEVLDLTDRLDHRPSELSGGQQQRVAVARALVARPEVVFADEPTGNLDSSTGHEILSFMRDAVDDFEQTTVMVTHDPSAAAWADRVVVIVDGALHHELRNPDADQIRDLMKQSGR